MKTYQAKHEKIHSLLGDVSDRYASVGHGVTTLARQSKMKEMMCRGVKEETV